MPDHIVLPSSLETFRCFICMEDFLNKSAYLKHVPKCARKHRESLITLSEEHQAAVDADPFQRVWDPEALEWVLARNRERR